MDTPTIYPDTLSATDLFGAATRLVHGDALSQHGVFVASNGAFRIIALVLVMAYMLLLMHRADTVRSMIAATIGGSLGRQIGNTKINPSERRNLFAALSGLGLITLTVTVVYTIGIHPIGTDISAMNPWTLAGIVIAALAIAAAAEYAMLRCIGFLSERADICDGLLKIKLLHFATFALVILPLSVPYICSSGWHSSVWLCIIVLQTTVSIGLFVKESLSLFISQRISILHWFLYLCSVELLPASVLLAPVLRGNAGV
ncbi:MAG: DUF4271 domain-containing protein [Alistipes sp.]